MAKLRKEKMATSGPQKRLPVLPFLYALLVLGLGGLAGWLTYLDASDPSTNAMVIAQAEIQPPVAVSKPSPEVKEQPDHNLPAGENSSHTAPAPYEDADNSKTEAEAAAPKEESHSVDSSASDTTATSHDIPHDASHPNEAHEASSKEDKTDVFSAPPVKPKVSDHAVPPKEKTKPDDKSKTSTVPADDGQNTATSVSPKAPTKFKVQPAPAEEKLALAPVPDPELAKKSDFGLLPVISPAGKMPWRTYARPFVDPLNRPRIAIVMSEMGMSESATKTAIQKLPGSITLSFNPYARELQGWIEQARAAGHEVLLQLPMEPFGYPNNDPGPHSLLISLTDKENLNRLEWMLGRFTGYSGVTNQMGSRFTSSILDVEPILKVLKSRGLIFLDGRTSAKSVAGKVAAQLGMPVAINNRFLDNKADRANIDARLADLERIARYTGTAIGVAYPYPVTMERLAVWAQTLNRKGFVLAPVSATVNRQEIQ